MSQNSFTYFFDVFVVKTIYVLFWRICRENDLRASSGKFLRVKVCQPESFDFLGLCPTPHRGGFNGVFISNVSQVICAANTHYIYSGSVVPLAMFSLKTLIAPGFLQKSARIFTKMSLDEELVTLQVQTRPEQVQKRAPLVGLVYWGGGGSAVIQRPTISKLFIGPRSPGPIYGWM